MHTGSGLPAPDVDALAHSERVRTLVGQRIDAAGGFLPFADYMDCVLYAPGLGYYSGGSQKFGAAGDFVTAPELGSLFARGLARTVAAVLDDLRGGSVLEVGGGSGILAADLLTALRPAPPERYLLLEISADLRERQRETLARLVPDLLPRVTWLDRLPAEPIRGVVLANEVLDALPVERFRAGQPSPVQFGVTRAGRQFLWAGRAAPAPLEGAVAALGDLLAEPLAEGYTSELCLKLPAWLATLGAALGRGLILLTDYGGTRREIYHRERAGGTLACHYRHRRHTDPFLYPGLQDITAWVDFSATAAAGRAAGLTVAGYGTQAHYLLASGVLEELDGSGAGRAGAAAAQEAARLLLPGEMGERFKVLALTRGWEPCMPLLFRDLQGWL